MSLALTTTHEMSLALTTTHEMSLALTTTHENGIFRGVAGRYLAHPVAQVLLPALARTRPYA
jgi:hypothetical protein